MWNYYRGEPNDFLAIIYNANQNNRCKGRTTRKTSNANRENGRKTEQNNKKAGRNLEIVVPLKYSNNFWRSLDMSLINCEDLCL